jgi:hypothetical protein
VFTHKDHTATHQAWRDALGAKRVLHAADVLSEREANEFLPCTSGFEVMLSGVKAQPLEL